MLRKAPSQANYPQTKNRPLRAQKHVEVLGLRCGKDGTSGTRVYVYQGQQAQEGADLRILRTCRRLQQQPGRGQQLSPLAQQGQVQQYQTHVFAPVVTCARILSMKAD